MVRLVIKPPCAPDLHEWGWWSPNVCLGERPDGSWGAMYIRYCDRCATPDRRAVIEATPEELADHLTPAEREALERGATHPHNHTPFPGVWVSDCPRCVADEPAAPQWETT